MSRRLAPLQDGNSSNGSGSSAGKARGVALSTTSWLRTARKCAFPMHTQDIGVGLLATILKQAHISRDEWFSAK